MNNYADTLPFVALIDDDQFSAHLLTRMLLSHGSPKVNWYGDAVDGEDRLRTVLRGTSATRPSLLIVDLKSHSRANLQFVASIQSLARQKGVPVAVLSQTDDPAGREALYAAGASAVFHRQADLEGYRREAANIVSFLARDQRLDAVGM